MFTFHRLLKKQSVAHVKLKSIEHLLNISHAYKTFIPYNKNEQH